MGKAMKAHEVTFAKAYGHLVVYVKPVRSVRDASVSIGKTLAAAIMKTAPHRRSRELGRILAEVLATFSDNVTVRDIDVLFHPAYEIDVLRLLEDAYRKKHYSVIWPGEYSEGELTYSEHSYADYKEYAISDYDILCVC